MPRRVQKGNTGGPLGTLKVVESTLLSTDDDDNIVLDPSGSGSVVSNDDVRVTSGTSSTDTTTGAIITSGGIGVSGDLNVGGELTAGGLDSLPIGTVTPAAANFTNFSVNGVLTNTSTSEAATVISSASGTVTHDYNTNTNFIHATPAGNFTANFTNVPTTDGTVITFNLIIYQGNPGRYASGVQINGTGETINWSNSTLPLPSFNKKEIQSFNLIRSGGSWTVTSSYISLGELRDGSSASRAAESGFALANEFKDALGLTSGFYWIQSATMPNPLQMYVDMTYEGGGYDFYAFNGTGTNVNKTNATNSGIALGLDLVYPRSKEHWRAMSDYVRNVIGSTNNDFFPTVYAVSRSTSGSAGSRSGNYTSDIMRDPNYYGTGTPDWGVPDGGRWWLRDSTFGEPNGDYTAYNFLGGYTFPNPYTGQDIGFNDVTGTNYQTGSYYLCSTNAKP